jgi:hypothetical protein
MVMQSRDDALVDIFIPVLNEVDGTAYVLLERPDEIDRQQPNIEAVAIDPKSGATLRIEHTRLEPFEGEGSDFGRLREVADALESASDLPPANHLVEVDFDVGAFDVFKKWRRDKQRVIRDLTEVIRSRAKSMGRGSAEVALSLPEPLVIGLSIERQEGPGVVLVGRRNSPLTFDVAVRRCVDRKLPKLMKEPATRHVLLLERYVPVHSRRDIGRALRNLRNAYPDLEHVEVWVADTNGWHASEVVGFYRVFPAVDVRTRWVHGVPEVKLPHKRHL